MQFFSASTQRLALPDRRRDADSLGGQKNVRDADNAKKAAESRRSGARFVRHVRFLPERWTENQNHRQCV